MKIGGNVTEKAERSQKEGMRRIERDQREDIVDWMVTRCGKIATVGSHVPQLHVPRTGTLFWQILRAYEWAFAPIDRRIAGTETVGSLWHATFTIDGTVPFNVMSFCPRFIAISCVRHCAKNAALKNQTNSPRFVWRKTNWFGEKDWL